MTCKNEQPAAILPAPGLASATPSDPAAGLRSASAVLGVLFLANFLNSLDRSIMAVVAQPIKEEFALSDSQLGLLIGFSFTLLYVVFGFPMARLADSGSRSRMLTLCIVAWSGFTALCGMAANFVQLCLCRAGVGIGEAGCIPNAHSLISDYFPREARTRALAIFGLGLPLGGLAGAGLGGLAMDLWGWRTAFVVVGLPGIAVALLTRWIVKEPPRGRFDVHPGRAEGFAAPQSLAAVLRELWKSPVARNILIGLMAAGLAGAPNGVFLGPYLVRKFGLGYAEMGAILAATFMLGSAISTIGGGLLIHWAARRDERWAMWIPALGIALSAPLYVAAYVQDQWLALAVLLFAASVVNSTYLAPSFAALHSAVAPGGRAKASVTAQFGVSLMAGGIGPLLAGIVSDLLAGRIFGDFAAEGFLAACPGGRAPHGGSTILDQACSNAAIEANQLVLAGFLACMIWPAAHFYLAARAMKRGRSADQQNGTAK